MRAVLRVACILGASVIYSGQLAAEPGKVVNWLMNEPLTLWDMGMIRIEQAAEKASAQMNLEYEDVAVHYLWDKNEIIVSFFGRFAEGHATHDKCNEVRRSIIGDMTKLNIKFISRLSDSMLQRLLTGSVNEWFSHKHFRTEGRDKKLGEKMSNKIYIEVMLLSAPGPKGIVESAIRCNGKILSLDAPSQPTSPDLASAYRFPPHERADAIRPRTPSSKGLR